MLHPCEVDFTKDTINSVVEYRARALDLDLATGKKEKRYAEALKTQLLRQGVEVK